MADCVRVSFVLLTVLAFVTFASGQMRFDAYSTDNGLPQNGVRNITQTPDGYLWFTTFDGLVRYDGVNFRVFDKYNTKSIPSNRFSNLFRRDDGTLVAGTEDGGIVEYRNGTFRPYTVSEGLPSNIVIAFRLDPRGEMYAVTAAGDVYLRDGSIVPAGKLSIPDNSFNFFSQSGDFWTYENGEVRQTAPDGHQTVYPIAIRDFNGKLNGVRPFEDSTGNVWIGDLSGVYILNGGSIKRLSEADGVPSGSLLRPFVEDADGGIWFSTGWGESAKLGVVKYVNGTFSSYGKEFGLSDLTISQIFKDREGTIWVATDRGLNHLRKQIVSSLSTAAGLIHNEVYPLLKAANGDVYVGTTRGLSAFSGGKFTEIKIKNALGNPVSVSSLYEDANKRLWIGAVGDLHIYENGKLRSLAEMSQITVWDIEGDREGNIWAATEKGIFKFRGDKLVAKYTKALNGLPSDDVKVIHIGRDGMIWFGTYGGLVRFDGSSMTAITAKDGLATDRVRSIYEDADGVMWIGTYDGGLSRYADGRFFNYTVDNGLFNNGVFKILEDGKSNFWISCNRGIYRVSRNQLNDLAAGRIARVDSVAYGKNDGMLNTEANGGRQPAGIRTDDGKFWFPTQDGVAVVDPALVEHILSPPQVLIENVIIDRQVSVRSDDITLRADRDDLEIRFTGITFIKPEQVKFRYRIAGLNEAWVESDTRREVYFPFLPAGDYIFQVAAANADGVWSTNDASLRLRVLAPFWRTTWFVVLLAVASVLFVFVIFKARERQMKRRAAMQQDFSRRLIASQENERKRIASEMHDSIGQYLLAIKNWAMFGLNSVGPDDTSRKFLTEVSDTSAIAINEVREIAHNLRPYQLERLGLTNTLRQMLAGVEASSPIGFSVEIADVDGLLSEDDEIIFYRIVQECVNNVIKHSEAANANLNIRTRDGRIDLICGDDGRGFDVEAAKRSPASGLGLNGIIERVRILNGEISIDSSADNGTLVAITVRKKSE